MSIGQFYILAAGLAFAAIALTGRRLSRASGARNVVVLTAHKILSLAGVALVILTAVRVGEVSTLTVGDWAATAASVALFVAAMITGGLLSRREAGSRALRTAHRVISVATALATALALYVLLVSI